MTYIRNTSIIALILLISMFGLLPIVQASEITGVLSSEGADGTPQQVVVGDQYSDSQLAAAGVNSRGVAGWSSWMWWLLLLLIVLCGYVYYAYAQRGHRQ